jgi:hypothetical protein
LYGGRIGYQRHFSAKGIDLANEVTLGSTANCGIARHPAYRVIIHRYERRAASKPGRSQGRLDAGMTGADDNYVAGG